MSIITIVQTITGQMNSNNSTYRFFHGEKDWQNLQADEEVFPAVYLDQPIRNDYILAKSGYIGERYPINVLFLFKSELEWTPQEHEANCITKARIAAREFITRLQNADDLVDEVDQASGFEFINIFNVNVSGVGLQIRIKPNINVDVCLD